MTTDHMDLRAAASPDSIELGGKVFVSPIAIAELLAAYDSLVAAGSKPKKATGYSPEFEEAWSEYPTRPGNSKAAAWKAWQARLKAKVSPETLVEGVRKYAAYCNAKGTEAEFVKMASTFFGPAEHYAADWALPREVVRRQLPDRREQKKADANAEALRILDGIPPMGGDIIDMEDCNARQ
jgi:hypothetical protein